MVYFEVDECVSEAILMGVGDEELGVAVVADLLEKVLHAFFVEFFEYVVEQEDGGEAFMKANGFEFGQFECEQQAFSLSLGCDLFEGLLLHEEVQVVFVDAGVAAL